MKYSGFFAGRDWDSEMDVNTGVRWIRDAIAACAVRTEFRMRGRGSFDSAGISVYLSSTLWREPQG